MCNPRSFVRLLHHHHSISPAGLTAPLGYSEEVANRQTGKSDLNWQAPSNTKRPRTARTSSHLKWGATSINDNKQKRPQLARDLKHQVTSNSTDSRTCNARGVQVSENTSNSQATAHSERPQAPGDGKQRATSHDKQPQPASHFAWGATSNSDVKQERPQLASDLEHQAASTSAGPRTCDFQGERIPETTPTSKRLPTASDTKHKANAHGKRPQTASHLNGEQPQRATAS
jgi:hypothetical protein